MTAPNRAEQLQRKGWHMYLNGGVCWPISSPALHALIVLPKDGHVKDSSDPTFPLSPSQSNGKIGPKEKEEEKWERR